MRTVQIQVPDGTTHADIAYLKREGGVLSYMGQDGQWIESSWQDNPMDDPRIICLEIAAWTGEIVPPVGIICEYRRVHEWQRVEVFAVKPNHNGSETALFTYENGTWCGCAEPFFFRPIRTPEQIAAEVRDREIADLYFTINWNEGRETWPIISSGRKADYAKAIDAGYRKFEITDDSDPA
jgi:hypothetical protein